MFNYLAIISLKCHYLHTFMTEKNKRNNGLSSIAGILREMRVNYRLAKQTKAAELLTLDDFVKLNHLLGKITSVHRDNLLEQRITELENGLRR